MSDQEINKIIRMLRTESGWWNGDPRAREVLRAAFEETAKQRRQNRKQAEAILRRLT